MQARDKVGAKQGTEALAYTDSEKTVALKKILSVTIIANSVLLVFAAGLFGLSRYHRRLLAKEAAQSREDLALRDSQLAKLTSALSGQARFNIAALNTNSRLLPEKYGGFLPRQGHEYAEQIRKQRQKWNGFGWI